MSETMNLRPFSNLPETDEIKEGDKVLVNQDGIAKQLDASKLGGGGGTIYAELIFDTDTGTNNIVRVYSDESHSNMLTYDQAKEKFKSGVVLYGTAFDLTAVVTPLTVTYNEDTKTFTMVAVVEGVMPFIVLCADSIT